MRCRRVGAPRSDFTTCSTAMRRPPSSGMWIGCGRKSGLFRTDAPTCTSIRSSRSWRDSRSHGGSAIGRTDDYQSRHANSLRKGLLFLSAMHSKASEFMPAATGITLSELIGSLSYALDITEGQPAGHCMRCCWIGMHIGREIGLPEHQLWNLYYTLLLKDLGCSSNAARICELYLTDDLNFKHDFKFVGESLPQVLQFVFTHTGLKAGLAERFRTVFTILRDGGRIAQ